MWTPHFFFDCFELESNASDVSAALNDQTNREFFVEFHLDDTRLRRNGAHLQVRAPYQNLTIPVANGGMINCVLVPDESGRVGRAVLDITAETVIQAFWTAYNLITPLLTYWAVADGGSFALRGVRILDKSRKVVLRSFPDAGIAARPETPAFVPPVLDLSPLHLRALSLYRESRNSSSPYYSLLCSYKLMEAFGKGGSISSATDRELIDLGVTHRRQQGTILPEMLELARAQHRYADYVGMKFSTFKEKVTPVRNMISHAVTTQGEMFDFDDIHSSVDVIILSGLCDLVARELLKEELRLRSVISSFLRGEAEPTPYVDEDRFNYARVHRIGDWQERDLSIRQ